MSHFITFLDKSLNLLWKDCQVFSVGKRNIRKHNISTQKLTFWSV